MNRAEYLELLRDYVSQRFSLVETEDIIRDYEEFFVEGMANGKTEAEVIQGLGSPKLLVEQLVEELQPPKQQSKTTDVLQTGNRYIKKLQKKLTHTLQIKSTTKQLGCMTRILRLMTQCIALGLTVVAIAVILFIIMNMVWTGLGMVGLFMVGGYFLTANVGLGMVFFSGASICLGFFLLGLVCVRSLSNYVIAYIKRAQTWWHYHVNQAPKEEIDHE